jgi:TPR repeat protein
MQSHAEPEMQEAVPIVAAGVEDPRVSAFLTRMATIYEELEQIGELFLRLSDRVQGVAFLEEPPIEVWTLERNAQVHAELEAALRHIAVILTRTSASAAELGSWIPGISGKSSSDEEKVEEESDDEDEVLPNSMAAAIHFFNKIRWRIQYISTCHDRLGDIMTRAKANCEQIDALVRGKSAEELQEIAQQLKPKIQQSADLINHSCSCHSLSDSPSSMGFKSASPVKFQLLRRSVSPVLRPRLFVEKCVDAAARLYSTQEYAGAVEQYVRAVHAFDHVPSMAPLAWILLHGRRHVPQDYRQATKLVAKGDLQGCTHCAGVLSVCLLRGWGVAKDVERAWQLARTSAAAGSSYGQFALATLLHENSETEIEAVAQYQLSAAQGLDAALCALGARCYSGDGVLADKDEALRLYQLAAAQGFPEAYVALADHAGGDEKMRQHWLLQSFLAGSDCGRRSCLALGGFEKVQELLRRATPVLGIKETKQVDEERADGALYKYRKTDEV